jgi:uridylate kinase
MLEMASPEVSEPPRPSVVVFPLASKPWKPATTITRPASRSLKADECQIYTDVDGVYTTDPRVAPKAKKIDRISFEEMLENLVLWYFH